MVDVPSPSQVIQLANVLAPGFIMVAMRRKAISGALPSLKDELLLYGIASTAYFAIFSPIFHVDAGLRLPQWLWSILFYGVCPIIIGLSLMLDYQRGWSVKFARKLGLNLPHVLPTAWDYRFSELNDQAFVLVTMNDGSQIAGRWAVGSFASSKADERDMLISEMWEIGEGDQPWQLLTPVRSILICGKDIRYVEVI